MARPPLRSALLARALRRARGLVAAADRGIFALEVANARADGARGPAHWERLRSESEACFVVSTGRAGTLSLTALLAASPAIDARHEPEPRLVAASYLAWRGGEDEAFWRDAVAVARDRLVFGAHKRGKVYFEANNRMSFLAPRLAEVYPRSRFVHLVREPEGYIASAVRRGYTLGHPWDYARPQPDGGWGERTPEQRAAWLWGTTNQLGLDLAAALGPERVRIVRSRDLFGSDVAALEPLFGFLGVPTPPRARLQRALSRPRNAQAAPMPWGRELRWTDAEREAVLAPLAPMVAALGLA